MFFRKIDPKDYNNIKNRICPTQIKKNKDRTYIIENETGILGVVILNQNNIESFQAEVGIEFEFLMMIEEFLFMKYEYIILNNDFKNLEEKGWEKINPNQYKKNKAPQYSRRYYMEVKKPE